ncbi:MAG: FAD binding domain-containing protein, partial [Acetobacteraceae bacterium]|nr:FAD binding domain-containing protein [Acetobacteraceae bacterium]
MYAEFDLTMPGSLDELAQLLTQPKAAGRMMLAGGTVALVDLRARKAEPELVVSLHRI